MYVKTFNGTPVSFLFLRGTRIKFSFYEKCKGKTLFLFILCNSSLLSTTLFLIIKKESVTGNSLTLKETSLIFPFYSFLISSEDRKKQWDV